MTTSHLTTDASPAKTGQPIRKIINGMSCERVKRGQWNVLETKAGQKTGRISFTGTVREIQAI